MSRASKYQKDYWWPKVIQLQCGEFCKGCGSIINLVLDKINNDGDHSIFKNKVTDFQILCKPCNAIKNPRGPESPKELEMTASEKKNRSAEKPLMEWLHKMLTDGEIVSWDYFVCDGSLLFDISTDRIEGSYYKKYFKSQAGPFDTYIGEFDKTFIKLKESKS